MYSFVNRTQELQYCMYKAHLSNCQVKACSDILSSALNGKAQPLPNPAVITSSELSLRWSSSFSKCQVAFQIPATSDEQFVFLLSWQKSAGLHGQQFGQFSLNLVIQILFFAIFICVCGVTSLYLTFLLTWF